MISSILYTIDLFKCPLTLLFNKRQYITTNLGQFFSIGILIIEIILVTNNENFSYTNPTALTSNQQNQHRPLVHFDHKIMAVGIQDVEIRAAFFDPTVFSVQISNDFYYSNSNGNRNNFTSVNKELHPCNEDDFPDDEENFKNLGLANNFCLDESENIFQLEGFWDEPYMSFVTIEMAFCSNDSINNSCKSPEEIMSILNGKTFNIYYNDIFLNINNYENPYNSIIVNDYQYIDPSFKKTADYYFQNIEINSDEGLVFSQINVLEEVAFVSHNYDFYTRKNDQNVFFSMSIYSDNKTKKILRTYLKVQDLLAKMGGIMQSFLFLGYIFIHFEYSLLLKNTILNALYSFKKPKKSNKNKKTTKNETAKIIPKITLNKNEDENKNCGFTQQIQKVMMIQNKDQQEYFSNSQPKTISLKFERKLEQKFTITPNYQLHSDIPLMKKKPLLSPLNLKLESQDESFTNSTIGKWKKGQKLNFYKKTLIDQLSPPLNVKSPTSGMRSPVRGNTFFSRTLKILKQQNYKQSSKNLYLSLGKYIKLGLKQMLPFFSLGYEEELFSKCEGIYEKELDFIEILKKLQEIEKMKKILLNSNQQILFNFLKKPLIYLEILDPDRLIKANQSFTIQLKKENIYEMNDFKKAIDEFEALAENGLLSEVDKRIMMIIDKESSKFLKFADDSSPKKKRGLFN